MGFFDYKISILLLIIELVLLFVGIICAIAEKKNAMNALIICTILIFCFMPIALSADASRFNRNAYKAALESGYTIFVNGSPVDGTKLDIDHYRISVNEETKEVYLTQKNN